MADLLYHLRCLVFMSFLRCWYRSPGMYSMMSSVWSSCSLAPMNCTHWKGGGTEETPLVLYKPWGSRATGLSEVHKVQHSMQDLGCVHLTSERLA